MAVVVSRFGCGGTDVFGGWEKGPESVQVKAAGRLGADSASKQDETARGAETSEGRGGNVGDCGRRLEAGPAAPPVSIPR